MKHYDKFDNPLSVAPSVPTLGVQIAEVSCFHCGRTTRIPVERAFVDWEKVAESYRKRLEETWLRFHKISHDVEVMYGQNPAAEYMANEMRFICMEIRRKLDHPKRESGT